jgi:hypothetical protein
MAAGGPETLRSGDAIKTYRYLRIGMVGAVVLLGAAVALERLKVGSLGRACWQTSISAYYYTPARAIFVGGLMVIGFALIMIKGRGLEDVFLNFAGMLAPVVAVVPTGDLGGGTRAAGATTEKVPRCLPSVSLTESGGVPTDVLRATVENNFHALLIAGFLGLAAAAIIGLAVNRGPRATLETVQSGTKRSLAATAVALAVGWAGITFWDGFYTGAHTPAAVIMFVFLGAAVLLKEREHRNDADRAYLLWYRLVFWSMLLGAIVIVGLQNWLFRDHTVFALEAWEIGLFALFWVVQTAENWDEKVRPTPV